MLQQIWVSIERLLDSTCKRESCTEKILHFALFLIFLFLHEKAVTSTIALEVDCEKLHFQFSMINQLYNYRVENMTLHQGKLTNLESYPDSWGY